MQPLRGLLVMLMLAAVLLQHSIFWRIHLAMSNWQLNSPQPIGQLPIATSHPERVVAVKAAMQHAWDSYVRYAWGADELKPVSKRPKMGLRARAGDGFSGLGASIIDAVSTLHVMGMHDEFKQARDWIAENMTFDLPPEHGLPLKKTEISFFEITIRILGGLLSAYDLSGDKMFLDKAEDLGRRIAPAFEGSPSGIVANEAQLPWTSIKSSSSMECLAEIGTHTLEWGVLSLRTKNTTYRQLSEAGLRFLHSVHPHDALMSVWIDRFTGKILGSEMARVTIGSPADSYYEYLIKHWLAMGVYRDDHWKDRWIAAVDQSMDLLVMTPRKMLHGEFYAFVGEKEGQFLTPDLTHMVCFWPGNIALGVMSGAVSGEKAKEYLAFAKAMTFACYQLYNSTVTGLGTEGAYVDIVSGTVHSRLSPYLQRPEVVESLFYLWRATHDEKYREWAWGIFERIERYCKFEGGYSGLKTPNSANPRPNDTQETWFMAETLKYLYLIFSEDDVMPLDEWVFTTEAHPLRIATLDNIAV